LGVVPSASATLVSAHEAKDAAPAAPVASPKVARLMLAPRRPALERSGIARVGGRADRAAVSSEELVEEVDPQAELHERSI
jgi:hypothetical protein